MGLITKAVDKVEGIEGKEEPPVTPEAPPPTEEPKKRGKKKLLLLMAPLALILAASVLGYVLFLKPTPEAPLKATRRSISARKKMAGPPATPAKKITDSEAAQSGASGEVETVKQTPPESPPPRQPAQKAGVTSKTGEKSVKPKIPATGGETGSRSSGTLEEPKPESSSSEAGGVPKPIENTSQDRSPNEGAVGKASDNSQTPGSHKEKAAEVIPGPLPQPDEKPENTILPVELPEDAQEVPELKNTSLPTVTEKESELQFPEEDMTEETEVNLLDQAPDQEIIPAQRSEPAEIMTQKSFSVSDQSDSRAESYYKKGVAYQQEGELTKAMDSYRRALNFNPDHLQANMNLATAYLQAGRYKQAEQILVYLYASRPKDSKILYNFGVLLYQTGEFTSAENKLKKLLEMDPFHLEANLLLATIYEEKGETDQAIEACMRAYQINSAHPLVLYRLGRVWDLTGDPEKATMYYRQFMNCRSEKEPQLELAVRDRLKYLDARKGE
jgi:Tfp pilus assembly protein PilF